MTSKALYELYKNNEKIGNYTADKIAEYLGVTKNYVYISANEGLTIQKVYSVKTEPVTEKDEIPKWFPEWAIRWDHTTGAARKYIDHIRRP